MTASPDFEARLAAVESRLDVVAQDAAAARVLAAGSDRDLSDLSTRVEANRSAINALGVQTRARFDQVDRRLDGLDGRLDGVDGRLDGVDGRLDGLDGRLDGLDGRLDGFDGRLVEVQAGLQQILGLLRRLLPEQERPDGSES